MADVSAAEWSRPLIAASLFLLCMWTGPTLAATETEAPDSQSAIQRLDGDRVRIGEIVVHKTKHQFTVPGSVLRDEPPLEYVAVVKDGLKAYESLLEVYADAVQFNLACILIGLDAEYATHPEYQFDERALKGQEVHLELIWNFKGEQMQAPLGQLLASPGSPGLQDDWVYVGSVVDTEGRFLAQQEGSLIGIVHDPATIIEDRTGQGIGRFGELGPNRGRMPPVGTPVSLVVRNADPGRGSAISEPDSW